MSVFWFGFCGTIIVSLLLANKLLKGLANYYRLQDDYKDLKKEPTKVFNFIVNCESGNLTYKGREYRCYEVGVIPNHRGKNLIN